MARTRRRAVSRWDDAPDYHRRNRPKKRRTRLALIPQIDTAVYFKSPHWYALRDRIIAERRCCEACGALRRLSLHHVRYTRNGQSVFWQEQDHDLALLCWPCHQAWERHCKGHLCDAKVRRRLRQLMGYGLQRDDAFPAAVAADAWKLMESYRFEHQRRLEEGQRRVLVTQLSRALQALLIQNDIRQGHMGVARRHHNPILIEHDGEAVPIAAANLKNGERVCALADVG